MKSSDTTVLCPLSVLSLPAIPSHVYQAIRIFDSILSPKLAEFETDIRSLGAQIARATLKVRMTYRETFSVSEILPSCKTYYVLVRVPVVRSINWGPAPLVIFQRVDASETIEGNSVESRRASRCLKCRFVHLPCCPCAILVPESLPRLPGLPNFHRNFLADSGQVSLPF